MSKLVNGKIPGHLYKDGQKLDKVEVFGIISTNTRGEVYYTREKICISNIFQIDRKYEEDGYKFMPLKVVATYNGEHTGTEGILKYEDDKIFVIDETPVYKTDFWSYEEIEDEEVEVIELPDGRVFELEEFNKRLNGLEEFKDA